MVERVALAIGRQITRGTVSLGPRHDGSENGWLEAARAAIEAMREPTVPMVGEGQEWALRGYDRGGMDNDTGRNVWRGMIDEALKE